MDPRLGRIVVFVLATLIASAALAQRVTPTDVIPYVTITGASVVEGNSGSTTDAVFVVRLSEPARANAVVAVRAIDGTATSGRDYQLTAETITIPAGQSSANVVVLVFGDDEGEPDERFTVQATGIQNASNAYGPSAAMGTIVNDDAFASVTSTRVPEGNSGMRSVTVSIARNGPATTAISGSWRTANGTATAPSDYESASGTFTIAAGASSAAIQVNVVGDTVVEPDETFTIELFNVSSGRNASGTVTIANDDETPVLRVSIVSILAAPFSLAEGDSGQKDVIFTITVDANEVSTVNYTTVDGSANAGTDYATASGTLTVPNGVSTHSVTVKVNGDITAESDETFSLRVTSSTETRTVSVTITDDDSAKAAGFAKVSGDGQTGKVGATLAPLVVSVRDALGRPVVDAEVQWQVTQGSATLQAATSKTNAEGRAEMVVTLGNTTGAVQVTASTTIAGERKSEVFTLTAEELIQKQELDPVSLPIAIALERACAAIDLNTPQGQALKAACDALRGLNNEQLGEIFPKVAPQQASAQIKAVLQSLTVATTGLTARLNALRSGSGGAIGVDQLVINIGGRSVPVSAIAHALGQRGGAAGDGDSRLSAFISGTLGSGDRRSEPENGIIGYELDYGGLTIGVDHSDGRRVIGVALSKTDLDSQLDDGGGTLETSGYSVSVYGSIAELTKPGERFDGMYVDGYVTYGRNDYDTEHVVTLGSSTFESTSNNTSDMYSVGGTLGIGAHKGALSFDGFVRGSWASATVDGFDESGTNPLALRVESQQVDSLLAVLGIDVAYAWSTSWGVLRPSVRASLLHEFEDGARLITARFINDRQQNPFTVPLDRPDRNFANISAGLQALFPHGWSAFVQYSRDTARTDLNFQSVAFGVRKEF